MTVAEEGKVAGYRSERVVKRVIGGGGLMGEVMGRLAGGMGGVGRIEGGNGAERRKIGGRKDLDGGGGGVSTAKKK